MMVLEHSKAPTGTLPTAMIDVPTGKFTETDLTTEYTEHTVAVHSRPRPTAYVIPKGLIGEAEILRVTSGHAIPYYEIAENSSALLSGYVLDGENIECTEERTVIFERGAFVFPNTVPSTILSVIMEPDFNSISKRKMSLYSMLIVKADENNIIPIYRYCHDLKDGRIEVN